jgi:predicted deacylase
MADAFGFTTIKDPRDQPINLRDSCIRRGIAAITVELRGNYYLFPESYEPGVVGLLNVLKSLGMMDGDLVKQAEAPLSGDFYYGGMLQTPRGGLIYYQKQPGEKIPKGEPVAVIRDIFGTKLCDIAMPLTGYCWSFLGGVGGTHAVSQGDSIAYMFYDKVDENK